MKLKTLKFVLSASILASIITLANAQQIKIIDGAPLKLTYYDAPESAFGVGSVLVSGKSDAVLIDAQFTTADAAKFLKEIKKSRKNLKAILISYSDRDFYYGLQVFKKAYPHVPVYSTPAVIEQIRTSYKTKLHYWGNLFTDAVPETVIFPKPLAGNIFELEGKKICFITTENAPLRSFVWIPSIKAVTGGINVFGDDFHPWMADDVTPSKRAIWINTLNKIIALHPAIVIPGHAGKNADLNIKSVEYTKAYVETFAKELKKHPHSAGLIAAMRAKYPNAAFLGALELGAKVNTGEVKELL